MILVSVAEIVHHYLPRMVELHNYVNANSTAQKRINWNMLNRKVFGKLNLKLTDKTLENVIEAKPGAIEQVLWDLRRKVTDMNPRSLSRSNTSSQLKGKQPPSGYSEVKLGRKVPSSSTFNASSRIPTKSLQNAPSRKSAPSPSPTYSAKVEKANDGISYATGLKDELSQYGQNMSRTNGPKPETTNYSTEQGSVNNGNMDANANANNQDSSSLPPAHLIYKGHKMIPSMLLDIKNRQIRDLETVVNGLQKKVFLTCSSSF